MGTGIWLEVGDHRQMLDVGEIVTLTFQGDGHIVRYRVHFLDYGGIVVDGDAVRENGESDCQGIAVHPVDGYTVEVALV